MGLYKEVCMKIKMSQSQKFAEIKAERNKKKQWINIEQTEA